MHLDRLQQLLAQAEASRGPLADLGRALSAEIEAIISAVEPGREDPVLVQLLGPELSGLVRKVRWSTLVLNPGSTSTKVAVYDGLILLAEEEIHLAPDAKDGLQTRVAQVLDWLERRGLSVQELAGIAARGGLMAPVECGTYCISESMLEDLERPPHFHPSNLAAPMAVRIAEQAGPDILLTTTDPVTVDEVELVCRLTGSARILNDGVAVHYLNHRAVTDLCAQVLGTQREALRLVSCHMGGGMSAARHEQGCMVQVVQGFGGIPSANRSGALPLHRVIAMMESHQYTLNDLRRDVTSHGGLLALAGTNDFKAFFQFAEEASSTQRQKIELVTEFFARRVASAIMQLAAGPKSPDLVLLTGGLARDRSFCERVSARLCLPTPVVRIPGALEHAALAAGLLRVCAEPAACKDYASARARTVDRRHVEERVLRAEIFGPPPEHDPRPPEGLEQIVRAACQGASPIIALVGADNEEALLAVKSANEQPHGPLARFLLLGPYNRVSRLAWELDVPVDGHQVLIVDCTAPVSHAAELLQAGLADIVMKGSVTTADLLKGYLGVLKQRGLLARGGILLSHVSFFEIPGRARLLAITDAAINPYPDVETRSRILQNALDVLHLLGFVRPRVAVISAVEKPSRAVASSVEGRAIAERFADRDDLIIEGPLSVDLSLSPLAAREKGYTGKIQGDADLLLVPDIDAGNAIYKAFTITSGASTAGVVIGGEKPLVLTSRGDSARSKLASLALAVLLANLKRGEGEPR